MSVRSMQFEGMTIGAIKRDGNRVEILVEHAIIVKNMDDAQSDTRWYGRGCLTIDDLFRNPDELPTFPATLDSADIRDNQMTYRGEISIPFEFHGNVGIILYVNGHRPPLKFFGESMSFNLSEHEKYIEHI
ncbi:MAG: hypothetical protein V3R76_12015 [Gammaproteobacteria bacterium]